jgi:hypothetical protein
MQGKGAILTLMTIVLAHSSPMAHDLGIQKIYLNENKDGSYTIHTEGPDYLLQAFSPPIIPEKCSFIFPQSSVAARGILRFSFNCDEQSLTSDDKIILLWDREGVIVFAEWADGTRANHLFSRNMQGIVVDLGMLRAGSGSLLQTFKRYTILGIEHILLGIDHLLFVLGLLLLVKNGWMLVKTITAFTVAHSITLAFATLGIVEAPTALVDALVALSIVFVAVEIIYAYQHRGGVSIKYPWVVAFGFGLLHGFGFAGALNALGLPKHEIPIALLTFNLGVEIGQLVFVLAFITLFWAFQVLQIKSRGWPRLIPAYAIGTMATFWLISRVILLL